MTLKQFLKPEWKKIVVFIIFFIGSLFLGKFGIEMLRRLFAGCLVSSLIGFPFVFLTKIECITRKGGAVWDLISLLFDLIFWYLLSCFIVWIYDKVKKKD